VERINSKPACDNHCNTRSSNGLLYALSPFQHQQLIRPPGNLPVLADHLAASPFGLIRASIIATGYRH
jgi:hypothetical protein